MQIKFITFDQVVEASEFLSTLDEEQSEALVHKFSQDQPFILVYLMAVYADELDEEEQELLFYIGFTIWYALYTNTQIPSIDEETLDAAEADNEDMLNYLSQEDETGFHQIAEVLLNDHPQHDLLRYALTVILEEEEDEKHLLISEDSKSLMFIALKTIIDCFSPNSKP